MFLNKPVHMKCGHPADTIMTHVPYNNDFADVAACSFCFKEGYSVNQAACSVDANYQPPAPLPEIKRDYTLPVLGAVTCIVTIIVLIASL